MIIAILFWLLALVCCGYAIRFGGSDGRRAAALILAASILTVPAAALGRSWGQLEAARFAVDFALLAGLYLLMLKSERCWPVWMTGFHLVAVVTHLAILFAEDFTPKIYRAMGSFWAIPVLLSLLFGILLDRRSGLGPLPRRR